MADAVAQAHEDGAEGQEHKEGEHDAGELGADEDGVGVTTKGIP